MGGEEIAIPRSFLEMPRFWREDRQWLAELPRLIDEQCRRWDLRVAGEAKHGSTLRRWTLQHPGTGSQKNSSSVRPASRGQR